MPHSSIVAASAPVVLLPAVIAINRPPPVEARACGKLLRVETCVMQATTPLDPRVLDAMLPYYTDQYGNPHSRTHFFGWESDSAVEVARKQVPH